MKELLRLFNAVQVEDKQVKTNKDILVRTIRCGYVLDPAIPTDDHLLEEIESVIGLSGEKVNAAFHKSWSVIQNSSMEELVVQQIAHYITTYGYQAIGVYSDSTIYIPAEKLKLPKIKDKIPLVVVKAMDPGEILDAIIKLGSGIALAEESLNDIMAVIETKNFNPTFTDRIKNRELKARLNDFYGIVPSEPVEFLRHVISKLTDESLLIKNKYLIAKIKESNGKFLDELMKDAPKDLASIFFRFKPLFLAMKSISKKKTVFNRLRKQADKIHVPMPEDYLNSITSQIKNEELDLETLKERLKNASVFRKIRLAYALNYRLSSSSSIVYQVRNGRGWAEGFNWTGDGKVTQKALKKVLKSIVKEMKVRLDGETVYIPSNINYTLPATEKQFTGNFPTGSYISVAKDLIVGIHWENTSKNVDLDLSVISESGKIGWDSDYKTDAGDVLFSGDITSAPKPNGASELFYLRKAQDETRILMLNYFNFSNGDEVECKIITAQENPKKFNQNYMVDISKIVATANVNISKKQNVLGIISKVDGENRVYFANVSIGNSISSSNETSRQTREHLTAKQINSIYLKDVLEMAGVNVVDSKPEGESFIDLSPESLNKTTILDLINPQ